MGCKDEGAVCRVEGASRGLKQTENTGVPVYSATVHGLDVKCSVSWGEDAYWGRYKIWCH